MLDSRHFIPVWPRVFNDFACPECGTPSPAGVRAVLPGEQAIGEYRCGHCGAEFARDLPVGFALYRTYAWRLKDRHTYYPVDDGKHWRSHPAVAEHSGDRYGAERKVFKEHKRIVILNTIDFLYGHVVLKLFNAQYYLDHHPDIGLVVMVPRMFEWLVPDGVAEKWVFDIKLSQGSRWNAGVDAFVQEQLGRYEEVYLAAAYSHPEFVHIDIGRFSRVKPFDPSAFLEQPPMITMVARRDRLWYRTPAGKFIHRVLRKLGLFPGLFPWLQDRLIARVMHLVRKELPDARFGVVGLGNPGGMPAGTEDLRTMKMDLGVELAWCRLYARSQVAVGVHGSNMILPTAHAAGCVEILPYDRYGNMVQDISVRYHDRMQLFMYRFTDEFASPRQVARHVISMFTDHEVYRLDNQTLIF
ncbi:MAG TPA: hypothetical protein PKD45_01560 [Flavobacteriales bacterium]|nr:hypothetical protein [Flavobacteriales bacterium]